MAIPHGKPDDVDQVGIAVREPERIEWESYDGEPSPCFYLRFHQMAKGLRII